MRATVRTLFVAIAVLCSHSAAAQDVANRAKGAVELGWSYFSKGDPSTALRRFNQALIHDPDFAPAYFGIAYVYSVQNNLDLAIQNYRKSIEKDPTFSHSYSNLGLALLYSGKPKEALLNLKKALDVDPKNGDAHANIAVYYFDTEDYSSSWKHIHLAQDYKGNVSSDLMSDLKAKLPEPSRGRGG